MLTINVNDVEAVAENLPGAWTVTQEYAHGVTLVRNHDGLALFVSVDSGNKVRVTLTGIPQEYLGYNESRPSINVTLTPARSRIVARDITRRLLPEAEAMNALVRERMTAQVEEGE